MLIQKRRLFDMKAPDKIYIQQDMINNIPLEQKEFDDDVEYIRKDALLDWLKGKMTREEATEGFVGGYDIALKDVIKHIEALG